MNCASNPRPCAQTTKSALTGFELADHVPADRTAGQVCGEPLAQMPCFISIDRENIVLRLRVFALIS